MTEPAFTDIRGFNITAEQYLKQQTPAIKFPMFQKKTPKNSQYTDFDWGKTPQATPANTHLFIDPKNIVEPIKDGLGMKIQNYFRKKEGLKRSMKVLRQLVNQRKQQYASAMAFQRQIDINSRVRGIRNEVAGMTEEQAKQFARMQGLEPFDISNVFTRQNDINHLVQQAFPSIHSNMGSSVLSTGMGQGGAMGGLSGATAQAQMEMNQRPQFFGVEPTDDEDDLSPPSELEARARLQQATDIMNQVAGTSGNGVEPDVANEMALGAQAGEDLLGLDAPLGPLGDNIVDILTNFVLDDDVQDQNPYLADLAELLGADTQETLPSLRRSETAETEPITVAGAEEFKEPEEEEPEPIPPPPRRKRGRTGRQFRLEEMFTPEGSLRPEEEQRRLLRMRVGN